jgi:hypothetical protein
METALNEVRAATAAGDALRLPDRAAVRWNEG